MAYPNFLCIGAQKSGTTWLHFNMQYHPQIWTTPVKEIHYFDKPNLTPPIKKMVFDKRARFLVANSVRKMFLPTKRQFGCFDWYYRFLTQERSDEWYQTLFEPEEGQISGDITPAYARLDEEDVIRLHSLMPKAKIIYILRNPIDRMWSQAAMRFDQAYQKTLSEVTDDEILDFFNRPNSTRNSNYLETLRIWGNLYSEEQIYVDFFDRLVERPQEFLYGVYEFLGVEVSEEYIPETIRNKKNARRYKPLPPHHGEYLARRYKSQIEELHQRFDSPYTEYWLEVADGYLQRKPVTA